MYLLCIITSLFFQLQNALFLLFLMLMKYNRTTNYFNIVQLTSTFSSIVAEASISWITNYLVVASIIGPCNNL